MIKIQTSLSGSPLRSDGVDETGDANRTLVWVTHRTTGRGGHMTIGSIRTHSLNGQNSRRAANVEREVGQPSIGYLKRRLHTETVGGISHGSVPCLRPMGQIVRRLVVTFPDSHADRLPEVEYSERPISRRPQDEGGTEGRCSPNMELEMAVIRLQKYFDDCRTEFELERKHTPAVALRPPRRSGFTSTPVPRYSGKSNWEQYHEVFEAIVCSNGWDDVTAALQLLSHLDGDALNVALLVPESRRVVPGLLIRSLSDHYNSPGRLAECKRQFQRVVRRRGDDPSIFAIELETLARRAFIDIDLELAQLWRCPVMWCTIWKGTAQDCIDHMRPTHKVPLSVKAANLAKYFPAWTVTRDQWSDMLMPCISGVAIDTLLFSRVGSPLCHRYRLISRTGSHAAFRSTYLSRLRAFIEESDSAVGRRLHHRLAQHLAARVVKSTDNPASGHLRSPVSHRIVSRPRRPRRLKGVASSARGPESSERPTAEMSSVQALMELALPRFAMAEGPRQVHPPWSVTSESPASPAPSQIEPRRGEDSRCSMDQTSFSSVYLNLDALTSSSNEESLDVKKCEDFAVTIVCNSEEAVTCVNCEEVLSDEDFPAVFGRSIRRGQLCQLCPASPAPSQIEPRGGEDSRCLMDQTSYCWVGLKIVLQIDPGREMTHQ